MAIRQWRALQTQPSREAIPEELPNEEPWRRHKAALRDFQALLQATITTRQLVRKPHDGDEHAIFANRSAYVPFAGCIFHQSDRPWAKTPDLAITDLPFNFTAHPNLDLAEWHRMPIPVPPWREVKEAILDRWGEW